MHREDKTMARNVGVTVLVLVAVMITLIFMSNYIG